MPPHQGNNVVDVCLAITYSIISPLVLGFATIGMYLIYLAYRYNLLFVFNCTIDTKGLIYRALYNRPPLGCICLCFVSSGFLVSKLPSDLWY